MQEGYTHRNINDFMLCLFLVYEYNLREWRKGMKETLLGPNDISLRSFPFQGQKSLDFQGPPLPMALVLDDALIKINSSLAI
jgi:hypothetical protein